MATALTAESRFPASAQLCAKCSTAAVMMMDACMTCLNCGDSKCSWHTGVAKIFSAIFALQTLAWYDAADGYDVIKLTGRNPLYPS